MDSPHLNVFLVIYFRILIFVICLTSFIKLLTHNQVGFREKKLRR